ncbi:MAG TPA: hypothetical protein ENI17_11675 [Pseudomonas xinjiangensis]|uniref:Uncharacterized protein n=2 Tax=root TaxID=1 RepID=A0A7V1BL21_9GAMM|nr:hypothetical protein [Halopseudomonas xinjiangensis]HEC48271.1 hypothetical protein [Halopseudomonas xinjiangensis]
MTIRIFLACFLIALPASWAAANDAEDNHRFITSKIAEYIATSKQCRDHALERKPPNAETIKTLSRFKSDDVARFAMIRSVLMQQRCEQSELNELAYAIVVLENTALAAETVEAISAIKVLAFDIQIRRFQRQYENLPRDLRASLESLDYFNEPFDNVALRRHLSDSGL